MGVVLPLRCEEAPDVLERLGEPVAGPEVAADPLRQGLRRRGPQVPPVQQHDARVVAPEAAEHTHVGQGLDMQKWPILKGSFEHLFYSIWLTPESNGSSSSNIQGYELSRPPNSDNRNRLDLLT